MRFSTKFLVAVFLVSAGWLFPACQKKEPAFSSIFPLVSDYGSQVVQNWNDKFLEIERDADGYRPLPATRALAYLGLSAYEACLTGMPGYKPVSAQYAGLQIPAAADPGNLHWPTVLNASYAYLMRRFFSAFDDKVTALEDLNNGVSQTQIDAAAFSLSQQYGRAVAAAVWTWSKTDVVGHDAYLHPYQSHQFPPLNTQTGPQLLFPDWGQVRKFAISESDKICPEPPAYGASQNDRIYAEGVEVYARSTNASFDDLWAPEFWSDDFLHLTFSTGSRWISIANQVYKNDEVNLETALYTNAKLGLALNDAAVACWASKFHYQVINPVNLIQNLVDPNWLPSLTNPLTTEPELAAQYPSYPSEHASLAGAAAEVMTNIYGQGYAFTDVSHSGATLFNGTPRSFGSFYEMAEDCAISRVVAGLNFRMDVEQGVALGYRCGRRVNELSWQ